MKHIILAAFGTTTQARNTYDRLDAAIRPLFDDCLIHWTLTSPTIRRQLSREQADTQESLTNLLSVLSRDPRNRIVLQSVHVIPGHEFHRLIGESAGSSVPTAIGMPLLASPADYERVAQALLPLINNVPDRAVIILGHGTDHPSWAAYPALQAVLRRHVGCRVFAATLEKFPDSSTLIEEIAAHGYREVLVIPCLMVAGMHFKRDIIGDAGSSWKKRFECKNIRLTIHDQGLGMLDDIAGLLCDHIRAAFRTLQL